MILEKTLRWFGPEDPVTLSDIRQTGATGVVTALHHIPNGSIWPVQEIEKRKKQIESAGLNWHVVESLPVHNSIKAGKAGKDQLIQNYIQSIKNLSLFGIDTICYNFMPVLDWVRTDLEYVLPNGGVTMEYDHITFAAFDIHILERPNAQNDYSPEVISLAKERYSSMSDLESENLARTIILITQGFIDGLVDSDINDYKQEFIRYLTEYNGIGKEGLRENLKEFLDRIIPEAEKAGIKMAIHADDPAFPVLGLPRIVSTEQDLEWIFSVQKSMYNGLTFCSGSFSSNRENRVEELLKRFADRVYFLHLRNTKYSGEYGFFESGHLDGVVNIPKLVSIALRQNRIIPMRPDHGIKILDDHQRKANPGYALIGRMKGLAEIAGLEQGLLQGQDNEQKIRPPR